MVLVPQTNGQFGFNLRNLFNPVQNLFRPLMQGVNTIFGGGGRFVDDGTQSPQATGRDELFPKDCGREVNKGTGKLCFPDGILCQESKFLKMFKSVKIDRFVVYLQTKWQ